jgi:hypothetical protein
MTYIACQDNSNESVIEHSYLPGKTHELLIFQKLYRLSYLLRNKQVHKYEVAKHDLRWQRLGKVSNCVMFFQDIYFPRVNPSSFFSCTSFSELCLSLHGTQQSFSIGSPRSAADLKPNIHRSGLTFGAELIVMMMIMSM